MLLQFLTLLLVAFSSATCPVSVSSSNHCTCRAHAGGHLVTCSNFYTDAELTEHLAQFEGLAVSRMTLQDLVLNFVPHNAFQGLSVQRLEFERSTLMSLSDTEVAFEGLEDTLSILTFSDCSLENSWEWSQLKHLRELNSLSITGGDMNWIDDSLREMGSLKLREITFDNTKVSSIDDGAFANCTELYDLALRYNPIVEVKRSMFPNPANNLHYLRLNYNQIRELPVDLFTNMPKLKHLDVRYNMLMTLKEETFAPVWNQLEYLDAKGNTLRCDCRLRWVLGRSRIRYMNIICDEPERFKGKQVMDLLYADLWC